MVENRSEIKRSGFEPYHGGSDTRRNGLNGANGHFADTRNPPASFEARFGKLIAQNGVAAIPSAIYLYQGKLNLTAQEVWFISYILAHKWDGDLPHPRLNEMARQTGVVKQILHRYKNRLCEAGYLTIHQRYKENGGQDANAYDFSGLLAHLEHLIVEDPSRDNDIRQDEDEAEDGGGVAPTTSPRPGVAEPEPVLHDTSFYARYGRVILSKGIAAVPMAIFTCQKELGLTPQQVWFVSYIFSFKWTTALPHPSINKMAARTGYSKVQLHEIKSSLVAAGYVSLVHRYRKSGGQTNNAYDFSGLLESIRNELQKKNGSTTQPALDSTPGTTGTLLPSRSPLPTPPQRSRRGQAGAIVRGRASKEAGVKNAPGNAELIPPGNSQMIGGGNEQLTPPGNQQFAYPGNAELIPPGNSQMIGGGNEQFTPLGNQRRTGSANPKLLARVSDSLLPSVTQSLHKIETEEEKPLKRIDSNQFSPYISAIATDFSAEMGDPDHSISNVTQTLRIWRQSGLSDQGFVELMYEAKRRTRSYQGKQGLGGINSKMPYFFKVLRQLAEIC